MNNIIIIPIYKKTPNLNESISFDQCLMILFKHPIHIITFEELDISFYENKLSNAGVKFNIVYFPKYYFEEIVGYNQLLLSLEFYKRFESFNYMLIYQLDAYVFRDELALWCAKGYDIIGAPLIEDKYGVDDKYFLNHFNGGFALRNIKYCIRLLAYKGPILKPNIIYRIVKEEFKNNPVKGFIYFILRSLGRQNNIGFLKNKTPINEDLLFSLGLFVSWINCNVTKNEAWIYPILPSNEEAIKFAFERYPSYLYALNNNQLPMGCHAWEKYEYETFWKKHLQ
jgi:hypothetical protein